MEEHETQDAVLEDFVQTHRREDVVGLIAEIDDYLRQHDEALLAAFESDFAPMITIGENDDEAQGWLRHARERVEACMDLAAR